MPTVENRGIDLYYETTGDGETVAFVGDVGYGAWLWGWQHGALAGPYETLVWEFPGTDRSGSPGGDLEVATLAAHLEAVLADHGVRTVHLVGAGLGGMVALEYAHRYGRTTSLALFDTAASGDAVDDDALESLFAPPDDPAALRASLEHAVAADLADHPDVIERIVEWRREDDAARADWERQAAAMRSFDRADSLYEVTVPTRVFHGLEDAVVPPEAGRTLAEELPRGSFVPVDGGHLSFVEAATAVNDELLGFLDTVSES
jgi:3-oxoadipate enol-lactonase